MSLREARVKLNDVGRLSIPMAYRTAMGIQGGDEVIIRLEDNELRITTPKQRLLKAQAAVRGIVAEGVSLADELIEERRREAARDEGS